VALPRNLKSLSGGLHASERAASARNKRGNLAQEEVLEKMAVMKG
jgi:hypothetical protein